MNLVKRAAQVVGAGLSLSDFDRFLDMMVGGQPSYTGKLVSPQTALAVGAVWACVNRISEDIARMPCLTYKEEGEDRSVAKDHYLYPILMEESNPEMTAFRFKLFMQAWVLLAGNAYAEIQTNGRGQIMALWPWRADRTSISRRDGESGPLVYTYTMQSGKKYRVPGAKMFHLRGLTLNGIQGLSPIEVHKQTVGLSLAVTEHGARFFSNGARPLGIISHPQALSDKAKQNIQNSWMEMHQGLANAHRVAILEEAMKYQDVGYNMVDAQYIEAAGMTDETVARIYQVPQHKIGILDKCLPADAEVFTEEGPRRIADVHAGDLVWSCDKESGRIVKSKVAHLWVNGFDKILTIRTTNRELRCNARHKVLARVRVLTPSLASIGGYRDGDGKLHSLRWENSWVEAGSLEVGDSLIALKCIPESGTTDVLPSGRIATVGFAEFCGLLLADGGVSKVKGDPVGVTIARASTALYMDHYRTVMAEDLKHSDGTIPKLTEEERQSKFRCAEVARELDFLGLSGTALTKRIPGWVYLLTAECRLGFLRGFLDGDGTVDKKGRIVYRIINREMLSGLRHLCVGLGIPVTNIQQINNKRTAYIRGRAVTGKHDLYSFTCSDPGANRRIGSHDPRYSERFAAGKPFGRKGRAYPRLGGKGFDYDGLEISSITSIKESAIAEPVYDLEVETTHSYIADLTVVSNSTNNNIQQQGLDYIQSCMGSWSNNWEQEIGFSLLSPRERQTIAVGFDFTDLIMGDFQSLGTFVGMLTDRGVLNSDEVRRKYLKMNAQPDGIGKTFWKAVNMAPVSPEKIEADGDPNFLPPTPTPQVAPIKPPDKKKENYVNGVV